MMHQDDSVSSVASTPNSPIQLTPRSKIRALLAPLDDESDKENTDVASRQRGEARSRLFGAAKEPANDGRAFDAAAPASSIFRSPKANYLVRYMGRPGSPTRELDGDDVELKESAYSRVKARILMSRQATEQDHLSTRRTLQPSTEPESDSASLCSFSSSKRRKYHIDQPVETGSSLPSLSPSPQNAPGLGLFLSPEKSPRLSAQDDSESGSEMFDASRAGERLKALVAQKRKERMALEAAATRSRSPEASANSLSSVPVNKEKRRQLVVESESDEDRAAATKLTQLARPTRKASKKAIEEISRETQRLSRNMQLSHEAKTKTKFTTEGLFAKFNFRQAGEDPHRPSDKVVEQASSSPAQPSSDVEAAAIRSTPPSSPPSAGERDPKPRAPTASVATDASDSDGELPTLADVLSGKYQTSRKIELAEDLASVDGVSKKDSVHTRSKVILGQLQASNNSDDDLEIIPANRVAIFDHIPIAKKTDCHSIQALRALAQIKNNEPTKSRAKKSLTPMELQVALKQRARAQAQVEKAEKIQALRDKGVYIQTAEEKEKDQLALESLVEKARKDAEELAKREKEAAKRERNGPADESHMPDSEDEDEDWSDTGVENSYFQLFGSENEEWASSNSDGEFEHEFDEDSDDEEAPIEEDSRAGNEIGPSELFDDEASEGSDGDDEASDAESDGIATTRPQERNTRRSNHVILDDEDEEDEKAIKLVIPPTSTLVAETPQKMDAFGFVPQQKTPIGLTQVFAGSMSDPTQPVGSPMSPGDLLGLTQPDFRELATMQADEDEDIVIFDSQTERQSDKCNIEKSKDKERFETQSQTPVLNTQPSELPDPTQDAGFTKLSPAHPASAQHSLEMYSTIDTVSVPGSNGIERTPVKRRRKLRRRNDMAKVIVSDEDDNSLGQSLVDKELSTNAFSVMRKAATKPAEAQLYDKDRSEAKGMVEEQAEESEDEYAGLGGASDDEADGDLDDETKKMIDDESNEKVDEQKLAAYFADKERADDEKRVEKLFKDINGGWRRQRGADLDFSDSDDDANARRQAKQREFARMRRALLADEKLGKIAENPKQQAFLQAIEDRDSNDFALLDFNEELSRVTTASQGSSTEASQSSTSNMLKRKLGVGDPNETVRLPPHLRRSTSHTMPTSLAQIRDTLSELIGEPDSPLDVQEHSASEGEPEDMSDGSIDVNDDEVMELQRSLSSVSQPEADAILMPPPVVPASALQRLPSAYLSRRRTHPGANRTSVIDRMALKRASTISTSAADAQARVAFHAPSLSRSNSGFRAPSLLRRATTQLTGILATTAGEASGGMNGAGSGKEAVKMGVSRSKSSVNYMVRERERRAVVEEVEKKRMEGRVRVGKMRMGRGLKAGLGGVVGGQFD